MGNHLKDIFSNKEPKFMNTITFDSEDSRLAFSKAIDDATENETAIKVSGVKAINPYIKHGTDKHLLNWHEEKISDVFLFPSEETYSIKIGTDYGEYTFHMKRIEKKSETVCYNDKNAVVHIRFEFPLEANARMNFTFKVNPRKANRVEEIAQSYNALRNLMLSVFKAPLTKEAQNAIDTLRQQEDYWKRIVEIEKIVGTVIKPDQITNSPADKANAEELYLLLVKKVAIRASLNNVTATVKRMDMEPNISIGMHLGLATQNKIKFYVYGQEMEIFSVNYYFDSIIDSIDECDDSECYKVKFCGTETKPLYKVMLGYPTEEDIPESVDFNQLYKDYSNAKTFDEIMDELYIYRNNERVVE